MIFQRSLVSWSIRKINTQIEIRLLLWFCLVKRYLKLDFELDMFPSKRAKILAVVIIGLDSNTLVSVHKYYQFWSHSHLCGFQPLPACVCQYVSLSKADSENQQFKKNPHFLSEKLWGNGTKRQRGDQSNKATRLVK